MKLRTHICMVSAQPVPNLTPVLDERTRPERVVLLVTTDMQQRAKWLGEVIQSYGVEVIHNGIRDAWDIGMLTDDILSILSENGDDAGLNVTGGTKLMAIVAHEVFLANGGPVFYVHPKKDRLLWLNPKGTPIDLQNRVRIENFIKIHGGQVKQKPDRAAAPPEWKKVSRRIIDGIEKVGKALGALNWLAQNAEGSLKSPAVDNRLARQRDFREIVDIFESEGFLRFRNNVIEFPDEKRRFFVNGGWLEYHVKDVVDRLRGKLSIQDLAHSLDVCHAESCDVKNELDVVFLAENSLYIIECKTKRFMPKNRVEPTRADRNNATEALYKLDVLKDYGGLRARGMLVSFHNLPRHDQERAEVLGIRTVIGSAIRNLEQEIVKWVKG